MQKYIHSQLESFGCAVDEDDFNAQTDLGTMAMKNIVAKIPGTGQGIILLLTHYDTKRVDNFVGAEDAGSSTGLMLEMARILCGRPKQRMPSGLHFSTEKRRRHISIGCSRIASTAAAN